MNQFGQNFRLSIWGESHGPEVGITLDGVPVGIPLSLNDFEHDLERRRSGALGTTTRHESDEPQILSGVYNGFTTGAPLTIAFKNRDARPHDYTHLMRHYRPSHADMAAYLKYAGFNDPRGGGHFSARLTVALTAAGVVAKKMLPKSVNFENHIIQVGTCTDPNMFEKTLREAQEDGDSVGAIVECRVNDLPFGFGEPFFNSTESMIAHLIFSIPAIKGVEFGNGFAAASLRGSQNNDLILDINGKTSTNNAGGINGGLTNGNQLIVRTAFKPTPSIARVQMTYNLASDRVEPLQIEGRHDICVGLRGAVVVEAAVAIALANFTR